MYTIHADGKLLFSTASEDEKSIVLDPKLSLDVNAAGSLPFVLPPGNAMHGSLRKLKTIITVEQDGEQIFRGRVMEDEADIYKQKNVYCEGDKSFLLDSVHAPYHYSGSVQGFFRKLVDNHNSMVEADRRFTVGEITAVSASETMEVESDTYTDTSSAMEEKLLNVYGGYLKTRTVGGVTYLDWLAKYSVVNSQPIEFAVNLLDLKDKVSAGDVFTVLIPLGASEIDDDGNYTDPLTVESVNNGLKYIQDDAAIALYGKIWRTKTWTYEDNPSKLLQKGRDYLKTGIAIQTLTLKAIDMHFADGNVQPIRIGDDVHIVSNPHGLDKTMICSKIEIDLLNPENTVYTFGEPPRTLTENIIRAERDLDSLTGGGRSGGGGRGSVKDELEEILRWARISVDEANANINLNAGEIDKVAQRTSQAEIDIDGLEAEIILKASQEIVDDTRTRLSFAGIDINGAAADVKLLAKQETLDDVEDRVSQAEIDIDGANSKITLKADKVEIDALETYIDNLIAGSVKATLLRTANISADGANIDGLSLDGDYISKESTYVVTQASLTVNSSGGTVTGVTLNKSRSQIYYLAWD